MCASAQLSHLHVYVFNTHGRAHCSTISLFIEALWRNAASVIKIFEVFTLKTERGLPAGPLMLFATGLMVGRRFWERCFGKVCELQR
jgi:hypothetical protein